MRLKLADMLDEVIEQYNLRDVAGWISVLQDPQGHVLTPPSGDHRTRTPPQTIEGTWLFAKRNHSRSVEAQVASHHVLSGRQRLWSQTHR